MTESRVQNPEADATGWVSVPILCTEPVFSLESAFQIAQRVLLRPEINSGSSQHQPLNHAAREFHEIIVSSKNIIPVQTARNKPT